MEKSLDEQLAVTEQELINQRVKIKIASQQIEELRKERQRIYEQNAAEDADISKKFDEYKTPRTVDQKHYDTAKSAIKVVYYSIRESKNGLDLPELFDLLQTRKEGEIRDAVWFLHDGGDIRTQRDGKWKI